MKTTMRYVPVAAVEEKAMKLLPSVFAIILACLLVESAAEIVILHTDTVMKKNYQRFYPNSPAVGFIPDNWHGPVDYYGGTMYIRFTVIDWATNDPGRLLFVMVQGEDWRTHNEATPYGQYFGFSEKGQTVTHETPVSKIWVKHPPFGWDKPITYVRVQTQNKVDGKYHDTQKSGTPAANLGDRFYPFYYRYTVVVVPKGETFSGWENYTFDKPLDSRAYNARPFYGGPHRYVDFWPIAIIGKMKEISPCLRRSNMLYSVDGRKQVFSGTYSDKILLGKKRAFED
jgi:hypothetical protein